MALTNKLENIAKAIRAKSGKTAKMTLDQMATEIANLSTGTDTNDANATAANIEKDKTAYVKGVKVTGTVPMYSGINMTYDANNTAVSNSNLNVRGLRTSGKVILDNNGYAATPVPLSAFGNAIASEVKKGKTFTSSSGWKITGTYEETGGGTDTSDATARDIDIAEGATAYVNGEKITGTLKTVSGLSLPESGTNPSFAVSQNDNGMTFIVGNGLAQDYVVRKNGTLGSLMGFVLPSTEFSQFGTAKASDVAAGKTFTSSSGLKVVGTNTGSGGTVAGMVMKTGKITLSTSADTLVIETGLSSVSCIMIQHAVPTSSSNTYGWDMSFDASIGKILYRSYGQYLSYNYGLNNTSMVSASGGTVTAKQYNTSYPIISGEFTWVAYGYE